MHGVKITPLSRAKLMEVNAVSFLEKITPHPILCPVVPCEDTQLRLSSIHEHEFFVYTSCEYGSFARYSTFAHYEQVYLVHT